MERKNDFPNTYREFIEMFPDDDACVAFLAKLRWPEGFICPACKQASIPWNANRDRLICPICRHQTSVTAGTIFDKTRTPLKTWFEAAWHVSTAKSGMSAKTLERTIGTSYKVAWMMLHRFRVAMVNNERSQLSGIVEVDESFVGGETHGGKRGRGTGKSIVVIAVEIKQPKGFGRVRMRHIPDSSGDSLVPFICDMIAPGSVVRTDGWKGYNSVTDHGYQREIIVQSSSGDPAHVSMPGVHRIASLFKRWILGTHQGSVLPLHLQSYLEEFTFRFNRRTSRSRGLVFRRLIEQAVITKPTTMEDIIHGYDWN
ncbi:MAG: IS1595 family transposase [Spirochaetia bacterium]|nr:IS1595 family transposase [Spirochaetia bacterium]NCU31312.1 IS1595 family transposase [Candidatus Saccharibacteria bacterium]